MKRRKGRITMELKVSIKDLDQYNELLDILTIAVNKLGEYDKEFVDQELNQRIEKLLNDE